MISTQSNPKGALNMAPPQMAERVPLLFKKRELLVMLDVNAKTSSCEVSSKNGSSDYGPDD